MTAPPSSSMIIATFIGAGATLKLADQTGENKQSTIGYITAIAAGVLLGSLTSYGPEESSIVAGIVIGVALAKKIDRPNLLLGLLMTVASAYVLGFEAPKPWLVLLVAVISLLDEIGHDRLGQKSSPLGLFFRYRGTLKVTFPIAAITSLVSATAAVGFLGFDIAYEAMKMLLSGKNGHRTT